MAQTIFIRLPGSTALTDDASQWQVEWCASDGIGRPTVQRESLEAVIEAIGSRPVVLLIPAEDIVLTDVDLPIRQRNKLVQAVPFALEEQLAEDVEKLHFAVGERQANGRVPVLVASHARMQQWLAPFNAANITPKAITADVLCLPGPVDDEHWSALVDAEQCVVRTSPTTGFSCDSMALADYLQIAEIDDDLRLKVATTDAARFEQIQPELPVSNIELDTSIRHGLEAMNLLAIDNGINLLQGQYSAQDGLDGWWRPYRFTAGLLVFLVLIATLGHALTYFKASAELSSLEKANEEQIARLFPEIKTLVPGSEKIQLQRRLEQLRGQGGGNVLFGSLSALSQGMQSVGNIELQELQLREGTLYLSMTAKDIDSLEKLKAYFSKQNDWSLEVQSANARNDGVQIRAGLRRAGS